MQLVIVYYPVAGCSSPNIHLYTRILRIQQMGPLRFREMSGNIYPVTRRHVPFCVLRISFFRALPTAPVCPSVPFILLALTGYFPYTFFFVSFSDSFTFRQLCEQWMTSLPAGRFGTVLSSKT
jgi:hypothetical protein